MSTAQWYNGQKIEHKRRDIYDDSCSVKAIIWGWLLQRLWLLTDIHRINIRIFWITYCMNIALCCLVTKVLTTQLSCNIVINFILCLYIYLTLMLWQLRTYYITLHVDILPPTDVRVAVVTSRNIQVTWKPYASSSSDVTGYLISYTTTASYTSGGNVTVDDGSTISSNLTNLEEDTLYIITVQATSSDNVLSIHSNEVSPRTYIDGK